MLVFLANSTSHFKEKIPTLTVSYINSKTLLILKFLLTVSFSTSVPAVGLDAGGREVFPDGDDNSSVRLSIFVKSSRDCGGV